MSDRATLRELAEGMVADPTVHEGARHAAAKAVEYCDEMDRREAHEQLRAKLEAETLHGQYVTLQLAIARAFGEWLHAVSDGLHLLAHRLIGDPDWRARNGGEVVEIDGAPGVYDRHVPRGETR